jgi:hypothetical protein
MKTSFLSLKSVLSDICGNATVSGIAWSLPVPFLDPSLDGSASHGARIPLHFTYSEQKATSFEIHLFLNENAASLVLAHFISR